MSLSVFISNKDKTVRIVRWILSERGGVEYASGPVEEIDADTFFTIGDSILREHLLRLRTARVRTKDDVCPVFEDRKSKRILRDQRALRVLENPVGAFRLIPLEFEKASIVGFRPLPVELERTVAFDAPPDVFWREFHGALSQAA